MPYTQTRDEEGARDEAHTDNAAHLHSPTACTWCTQLCCSYEAMLNAADGRRDRARFTKCSSRTEGVLLREQSTNRSCASCCNSSRRTRKSEASSASYADQRRLLPVCAPQNTAESRHFPRRGYVFGETVENTIPSIKI
jgi:hypothetical protein